MMVIGVDFAYDEGKNGKNGKIAKKWPRGVRTRVREPGVCMGDTRDGRGPTDTTYWRVATSGYKKPSEHRDILLCRSPTTAGKLPAHLGWYVRVIDLPHENVFQTHLGHGTARSIYKVAIWEAHNRAEGEVRLEYKATALGFLVGSYQNKLKKREKRHIFRTFKFDRK